MDQIEERLAEEIRKYDHFYNPSLTGRFVRQKKATRSRSGDVNKQSTATHKEGVS